MWWQIIIKAEYDNLIGLQLIQDAQLGVNDYVISFAWRYVCSGFIYPGESGILCMLNRCISFCDYGPPNIFI